MRKILIIMFLFSFGCKKENNNTDNPDLPVQIDSIANKLLRMLAHDSMEGRAPGSIGFEKSALLAESIFENIGLNSFENDTYRDSFFYGGKYFYNLIGLQSSSIPSDEYIIISAHLDHLGIRTNSRFEEEIYNGANDNASGVAVLLQIAKSLQHKHLNKNVLYILFTKEESRLVGSYYTSNWMYNKSLNISYMLNIDMVGRRIKAGSDKVFLTGIDYSNIGSVFNELLGDDFLIKDELEASTGGFSRGDNYPFYEKLKIPSHTFSTFNDYNYSHYHTPDDDVDKLDFIFINEIILKLSTGIEALINSNYEIKLNE